MRKLSTNAWKVSCARGCWIYPQEFFFLIQCLRCLFIDAPAVRCTMPRLARTRTVVRGSMRMHRCAEPHVLSHGLALNGCLLTPTSRTRGPVRFSHNSASIARFLSVRKFSLGWCICILVVSKDMWCCEGSTAGGPLLFFLSLSLQPTQEVLRCCSFGFQGCRCDVCGVFGGGVCSDLQPAATGSGRQG